jgi:predicted membrane chloride channel (bestrophin family)
MIFLTKLQEYDIVDLGVSGQGHSFAGMIVSFLVVSRINTALSRYNECRNFVSSMYRESRELIQNAFVFTIRDQNLNTASKEWRNELAYRCMVMLRTSVSVIQYKSEHVAAWEAPELSGYELDYCTPTSAWRRHAQTPANRESDSMRIPPRLAFLLRQTICSQKKLLPHPLEVSHELKLLGAVDSFMHGFYGMRKFMTTPVPFPLIQMTRTIVLVYVFAIPFVLLSDRSPNMMIEHCLVVFFLTFGYVNKFVFCECFIVSSNLTFCCVQFHGPRTRFD